MLTEAEKSEIRKLIRKLKRKNRRKLKRLVRAKVVYPDILKTDAGYRRAVSDVVIEYGEIVEALSFLEGLEGKSLKCAQKYAVLDDSGNIKHFKGPPGKGIRFRNCVDYFKCLGKGEERAKGICAAIARAKCRSGDRYACGRH